MSSPPSFPAARWGNDHVLTIRAPVARPMNLLSGNSFRKESQTPQSSASAHVTISRQAFSITSFAPAPSFTPAVNRWPAAGITGLLAQPTGFCRGNARGRRSTVLSWLAAAGRKTNVTARCGLTSRLRSTSTRATVCTIHLSIMKKSSSR